MNAAETRRESGAALLVTVLLLVLISLIGFAALDTVTRDQQVAGFQNRSRLAFYAGEAGVADAKDRLRDVFSIDAVVDFPDEPNAIELGDPVLFPFGQPRYYADPAAPTGVESLANAANPVAPQRSQDGDDARIGEEGFENTLWRIRVVGSTPDGIRSRLDVVATRKLGID